MKAKQAIASGGSFPIGGRIRMGSDVADDIVEDVVHFREFATTGNKEFLNLTDLSRFLIETNLHGRNFGSAYRRQNPKSVPAHR